MKEGKIKSVYSVNKHTDNFKRKEYCNNKAITLVALVVTVVVLIILAGVSINLILNNNGIISKAINAKDQTRISQIEEEITLWRQDNYLARNTGDTNVSLADFLTKLENKNIITSTEKDEITNTGKLKIKNKEINFVRTLVEAYNDGDIQEGDYLDYKGPENVTTYTSTQAKNGYSDQTYSTANNGKKVNWRVLGLSEDGQHLLLISGSPIQKTYDSGATITAENSPYLILKGAESYVYCKENLDAICNIYNDNNYAEEVRSITVEDINRVVGVTVDRTIERASKEEFKLADLPYVKIASIQDFKYEFKIAMNFGVPGKGIVYRTNDPTKTNIDDYRTMGHTHTYDSTEYSPASYLDGKKNETAGNTITSDAYGYDITEMTEETKGNTTLGNLLFSQTTYENQFIKSYWLASPGCCYCIFDSFGFGPGNVANGPGTCVELFYLSGDWLAKAATVRPVVSLKSDIKENEITPISGIEENWTQTLDVTVDVDSSELIL